MPRRHVTFFQDVHFFRKTRNCATPRSTWLACMFGLGLLGLPRLGSASLALPAPATTAAALRAARPPKAAGLLLLRCRQGERGRSEARKAKHAKASQAIRDSDLTQNGGLPKRGFGHDWASHGSKSNFDRLPREGIASRSCWRGQFGPRWPKVDQNIGGSDPDLAGFSEIFRICPGMVQNGPRGPGAIIWRSGGQVLGWKLLLGWP